MPTIRVITVPYSTNEVLTTSQDKNFDFTDFIDDGIIGVIANATPDTGGFAVQAQSSPDKTVKILAGTAYITATPTGGTAQTFRVNLSTYDSITLADNSTGNTKYDKILIQLPADELVTPPTDNDWDGLTGADAVLISERHDAADEAITMDNAYELAEVTVADGFTQITDGVISDSRENVLFNNGLGGAWISYTPTWSTDGDAPSLGNGTITGYYIKIGRTIHYRIKLTWGSTTTGGTGTFTFTLPVAFASTYTVNDIEIIGAVSMLDSGTRSYVGTARTGHTSATCRINYHHVDPGIIGAAYFTFVSDTAPFTMAVNDYVAITGTYESAS